MRIALVLPQLNEANLRLAVQIGATDIVSALPTPAGEVWRFTDFLRLRTRVNDAGLKLSVIEGIPVPDRVKLGLPGRDEDIEIYAQSIRNMGAAGIPIRGALATSYNHALMNAGPLTEAGEVTEEQLWESLEYFLRAIVPVAEEAGVLLAMHPDDPPLSPIRGVGRIMTSVDSFQRMIDLVPSPNNGLTFCQGCFSEMGADIPAAIQHFAGQDKVFFAHFRNLSGTAADFTERFHDEGDTDMYAAMRAYIDAGFDGPMRPDHVPMIEGDDPTSHAGYSLLGRLYAVGYMRGLIEAIEKSR